MRERDISKAVMCSFAGLACLMLRFCYTAFTSPVLHDIGGIAVNAWVLMLSANMLAQLAVVIYARRGRRLLGRAFPIMLCLCIMASIGMLLMYFGVDVLDGNTLCYVGGIMAAFGAGALPPCWKETSSCLTTKRIQISVMFLGVLVAALLYLLCLSLPASIASMVNCIAPTASVLFLRQSYLANGKHAARSLKVNADCLSAAQSGNTKMSMFLLAAYVSVLGIPQSFWKTDLMPFVSNNVFSWPLMVAGSILLVGAFWAVDGFMRRASSGSAREDTFLFGGALLVMLLPFYFSTSPVALNIGVFAGLLLCWVIIYSALDDLPLHEGDGVWKYAVGILVSDATQVAATLLGMQLPENWLPSIGICVGLLCVAVFIARRVTGAIPNRFVQEESVLSSRNESESDMKSGISKQCDLAMSVYELSSREREVLEYLVRGRSAKSTSSALFISYNTVKTYMNRLYKKLNVHNREDLIRTVENLSEE